MASNHSLLPPEEDRNEAKTEDFESGIIVNCDNPDDSEDEIQKFSCQRISRPHKLFIVFIGVQVIFNIVVIGISIKAITTRGIGVEKEGREGAEGKDCLQGRRVIAPLCVPCEEGMKGEEEEGGWRRFTDEESHEDFCCPLDHGQVASAVHQIYKTVLASEERKRLQQPPKPDAFVSIFGEPETTIDTLKFANRYKPSAHVTGVRRFNANQYYQNSSECANDTQVIDDWPLRVEPYLSMTAGYVRRLSWGLVVPASGLYRVHTSVNFYFGYPQERKDGDKVGDTIPVIHQIARYHTKDRRTTVLTERNHSISTKRCDGLTSFLVSTSDLDIGDVIYINVSHKSAMAMQDRWHTEGLFLVQ